MRVIHRVGCVIFILTIKRNQRDIDGWIAHAIKCPERAFAPDLAVLLDLLLGTLCEKIHTDDVAVPCEHGNREAEGNRHNVVPGKAVAATRQQSRIRIAVADRSDKTAECWDVEKERIIDLAREKVDARAARVVCHHLRRRSAPERRIEHWRSKPSSVRQFHRGSLGPWDFKDWPRRGT